MPLNQIKKYNSLLELDFLTEESRESSLRKIFDRDFIKFQNTFKDKNIIPTPKDGESTMDTLFNHLTRSKDNSSKNNSRIYDAHRSKRIHWIKHHFDHQITDVAIFSVIDNKGIRTYLFNKKESYVIILEPKKDDYYFLITAYYLEGGNTRKIENKMKRKLPIIY